MFRARALLLAPLLLSACLGDPAAHLDKARDLAFQRRPAEALAEYEEVLSLLAKKDPHKVRAQMVPALKGAGDLCYLEMRQLPRAVEFYRALANRYPEAPETLDARASLAEILRGTGDRRGAVAELSALVQAFPQGAEVDRYQYLAAKDYFELGDYDQAILESRVLLTRYPDSPYADDAQMLIGASLGMQSQREKAIQAYEEVARRWPASDMAPRARYEQAKILEEMGQEEKAVDVLVEALKTHPDPKGVQMEIARLKKRLALHRLPDKIDPAQIWEWNQPQVPP